MPTIDWEEALDAAHYDVTAGIAIAKLLTQDGISTFITRIDAGKRVNPHYHRHGAEHYHIIEGAGEITLHDIKEGTYETRTVNAYVSFAVLPFVEHTLRNTGTTPLLLMFSCPDNHLTDDRFTR